MVINSNRTSKFVKFAIILSSIPTLFIILFPGKIAVITMVCAYPLILVRLYLKNETINFDANFYTRLFQVYFLVVLIRGFFDASSEDDWKILFSSAIPLYLFVNFAMYLPSNPQTFSSLFHTFFSFVLFFALIVFFADKDRFPYIISPIYILMLMMPYLSRKFAFFMLMLALLSFFSDIANRSNMLNIIVAILISFTYLFRNISFTLKIMKYARNIMLFLPILFLVLGLTGVFNIFLIGETYKNLKISDGNNKEQVILVDSRTSIYKDVFTQLKKDKAFAFGLGASGKTETALADNLNNDAFSIIYKEGRRATESGMLNFIQWGGVVGGILYYSLFIKASYFALNKSNNWFCKMLGLWVAYKAMYSFVEDRLTFSISSLLILISIGICFNKKIRQLNDAEIKFIFKYVIKRTFIFKVLNIRK